MEDRQSALLWQLMQSLGAQPQESSHNPEELTLEHTLAQLRPLLTPKQQKMLDLMTKMQEIKELLDEIYY